MFVIISTVSMFALAQAAPVVRSHRPAAPDRACRSMTSLSQIPRGYHPVTVRWNGLDPDLVCIARTNTRQIQVSHWKGFAAPSGYRTLRIDHTLDTTFRGCAQYSEWQGVKNCMTSWPTSYMVKR
ncbi:hypothetical protein [uncultured Sphingomonas sp.]|uniref:hypothetical protein n=1 Tax=uncultured Sphingomonas sp. TaxID=158754 RepID=UPI0025D231D9|nr:hypothetical protein [uncultured Sphingomonas sp.]